MRLAVPSFALAAATIVGVFAVLAASARDDTTVQREIARVGSPSESPCGLEPLVLPWMASDIRVSVPAEIRTDLVPELASNPGFEAAILLRGCVADVETAAPVAGVRLSLVLDGRVLGEPTLVAADGSFVLPVDRSCAAALGEAKYFEIVAESLEATDDRRHLSTRTRLRTDRAFRGASLQVGVVRARSIEGRVLDAFGLPVRFAYLEVAPPSCAEWTSLAAWWGHRFGFGDEEGVFLCDGERSTARTDVDGRFRLASLTPIGIAECVILPTPTSADCPRIGFDISTAVVAERRDLDLVLPDPSTSVEGRVLADGFPTRGIVLWRDGRLRGEVSTDCDGRYRIAGIDAGSVEIRAVVRSGESSAIRSLELVRGERRDLDLEIAATSR